MLLREGKAVEELGGGGGGALESITGKALQGDVTGKKVKNLRGRAATWWLSCVPDALHTRSRFLGASETGDIKDFGQ